jgi:branched-chain amino acid transport system substrate-binding protein
MAGCNTGTGPPPIVIGHVSDKTRLDKAGDQAERGMRLALHDLNNDSLAAEFGGRKLEIRHTDTRGQLEAFESQAVRLDSVNKCLAILGGLSQKETSALQNAKVPLLTMHGQPVPGASNQVIYLGMSPIRQGVALAMAIAENAKATRVVILVDEKRSEAVALADAFQNAHPEARKQSKMPTAVVTAMRYGVDAKSPPMRIEAELKWTDLSQRIVDQETHTVVFAGAVQDFNAWHKVFRREFPDTAINLAFAGDDGAQRLFDIDGANVPVLVASAYYADPTSEKIAAFAKPYQNTFKTEADVHAALAYDGLRILVEAMKRTPTQLTAEKIRDELLKTKDFDGVTGKLTVSPTRQVARPIHVLRWERGTLTRENTFAE